MTDTDTGSLGHVLEQLGCIDSNDGTALGNIFENAISLEIIETVLMTQYMMRGA